MFFHFNSVPVFPFFILIVFQFFFAISHSKLYKELGLETLESRRRLKHLCFLHKIFWNGLPIYLYNLTPKKSSQYITRNVSDIATCQCRTDACIFSFFPWTITECNKTDIKIQSSPFSVFRNYLLKEMRPKLSLYTR